MCVKERKERGGKKERQREMMCSARQHYIRMCVFKCVCVCEERERERGESERASERESETDSKEIGVCMCARAYILVHVYIHTHDILGISHHRHFVKGRISKSTLELSTHESSRQPAMPRSIFVFLITCTHSHLLAHSRTISTESSG